MCKLGMVNKAAKAIRASQAVLRLDLTKNGFSGVAGREGRVSVFS